ncbi:ExeA family protein [Pseudoalteromonas spongiae]|uniref:ExeA family protein n=1 Tax=Pseudoalteromonas spongiae TaxID=298657 RepID=UPI00026CD24A|nr:AAA family ATPase [Pseudoalteromonas spongiae]ATC97565.1 MSHA biogenesis protein MshM [Pseudoalteromonas spongiae UST010723-006]
MYLSHFGLTELPFSLTPNTQFYCALAPHNEAMDVLITALNMGEGFIKVTGEVGTGKTLLCRKLLNSFDDSTIVAYIANSYLSPDELCYAIANELQIDISSDLDQQSLSQKIQDQLLALNHQGKRVVLIIDEAQCLSWDSLEAVRLFTNLETETRKLIQVVLFGQPELDSRLANQKVRQLRQRISFSYTLRPMTNAEVAYYIRHRLEVAGVEQPKELFSNKVCLLIAKASRGIPRLVNLLSHKVLIQGYGEGIQKAKVAYVYSAAQDTEDCRLSRSRIWPMYLALLLVIGTATWLIVKEQL